MDDNFLLESDVYSNYYYIYILFIYWYLDIYSIKGRK